MGGDPVPIRQRRQVQLPEQVIEEGVLDTVALLEAVVLFRGSGGCGWRGLVDVVPGDVDGQVFGNLLEGSRRLGGLGFESGILRVVGVVAIVARRRERFLVQDLLARAVGERILRGVGSQLVVGFFDQVQHGIGLDGLADLRLEFQGGELHQPDRLLQLRRHRQLLAHAQGKRLFHHSSNISPR